MIRKFEPIDDERLTPIEEYPGYLGHTWDSDFYPGPELEVLASFDLGEYNEFLGPDEKRQLILRNLPEPITCEVDGWCTWGGILSQLPSVVVCRDDGPANAGPASGAGDIFFIAEDTSIDRMDREVTSLREALDNDLKELRKRGE